MAVGPFTRQYERIRGDAAAGLYQAANGIINRSEELVPVDTGTLKSSTRVQEPEYGIDEVTVVCGYGYGDALNPLTGEPPSGYAVWVELRDEVQHPTGQAHFLSQAALEAKATLGEDVAASIRYRLPGGEVVDSIGGPP